MAEARGLGPRQCEFDSHRPHHQLHEPPSTVTKLTIDGALLPGRAAQQTLWVTVTITTAPGATIGDDTIMLTTPGLRHGEASVPLGDDTDGEVRRI